MNKQKYLQFGWRGDDWSVVMMENINRQGRHYNNNEIIHLIFCSKKKIHHFVFT